MNWKKYAVLAGIVVFSSPIASISWGQVILQPAPNDGKVSVKGRVQDASTKRPVMGAVVMAKDQGGTIKAQQLSGADGSFQLILNSRQTYQLSIQASGYDPHDAKQDFTSSTVTQVTKPPINLYRTGTNPDNKVASAPAQVNNATAASKEVNLPTTTVTAQPSVSSVSVASNARVTPPKTLDAKVIYTPPLVVAPVGKTTQLKAIQFVQSKAELLPDAMPALEQLLAFMQSKPTAEIELSGHTDNQGDFDENLRLSKQRVDVVKAYLVQNGIEGNRITTRGYGPTRPIASNKSETTRQLNRRVEMIVLKQ